MKKNFLLIILVVMLMLVGCSKVADEKQMQSDLESFTYFGFLDGEEEIKELVVEKRQTDKKQKVDTAWCTVTTEKEGVSYQKEVILTYGLYDKGWSLDDVSMNDSRQWIQAPLEGIMEYNISDSLNGQSITIAGETWSITTNNIKDIVVDRHDTDLEQQKDLVVAFLTLEEEVEEAKGEVVINYVFDNGWKIESLSQNKEFTVSMKPETALDMTNEDLIAEVSEQSFVLEAPKESGVVVVWAAEDAMHTVTINRNEISDFEVENQEMLSKGLQQIYHCRCTLTKPNATFELEIEIPYVYNSGEWIMNRITITPQCKSIDIVGEWTGRYLDSPYGGDAVLNILSVDENGLMTGTYSYYPSSERYDSGSYNVSGTIDMATLDIDLTAGDWIKESSTIHTNTRKKDILAVLCVDESMIKGTGQGSRPFELAR